MRSHSCGGRRVISPVRPGGRVPPLDSPAEHGLQKLGVVPDHEGPPDPQARRPKRARPPQHVVQKFVVWWTFVLQIEADNLLPFRHDEFVDAVKLLEGRLPLDLLTGGGADLSIPDGVRLKKLLSLFAACSARAVVPPLQRVFHWVSIAGGVAGPVCLRSVQPPGRFDALSIQRDRARGHRASRSARYTITTPHCRSTIALAEWGRAALLRLTLGTPQPY